MCMSVVLSVFPVFFSRRLIGWYIGFWQWFSHPTYPTRWFELGCALPHLRFLSQVFHVGFWCCKKQISPTHWLDWEDDLINEDDLNNENDLKNEDYLKFAPPPHLKEYYLDSYGTADIKPKMLSGVQTGNGTPHDKYNIHGITHARTKKIWHFHA